MSVGSELKVGYGTAWATNAAGLTLELAARACRQLLGGGFNDYCTPYGRVQLDDGPKAREYEDNEPGHDTYYGLFADPYFPVLFRTYTFLDDHCKADCNAGTRALGTARLAAGQAEMAAVADEEFQEELLYGGYPVAPDMGFMKDLSAANMRPIGMVVESHEEGTERTLKRSLYYMRWLAPDTVLRAMQGVFLDSLEDDHTTRLDTLISIKPAKNEVAFSGNSSLLTGHDLLFS